MSAYENAPDPANGPGCFGMAHRGQAAQQTGWIQFAARETEMLDTAGTGGAASRVPPTHRAALMRPFPDWTLYRHALEKAP